MKKIIILFLCAALLYPAPISLAGPKGGKVVGGNAQINQAGNSTTINQTTDRAIINWNSFDINKNESVLHNMPSSNSAGLHRVVGGGGASQIAGSLQSNGNIYLVNPAGVVIHKGAKIDVNGFVATSRDISDQNFMKGNMVFDGPGKPDASIINQGNITLKDNGLAVLVAPTVRNDGIIAGKLGKVALGGSDAAWKLDMTGDDLITFTLDEKAVNTLHSADGTPLASVENNGKIKAEGGVVVMSAAQLDGFVGSVVNNGEISAASVESKGGKIIFRGQGDKVDLTNNGKLDVSSQSGDGGLVRMAGQAAVVNAGKIDATGAKGGKVVVTGKDITLKSGSVIDVSGANGGGTVFVGGNAKGKGPEPNAKTVTVQSDAKILASAKLKGDGGQVVVWADEKTQFDGRIEAKGGAQGGDGGFVETSAKLLIIGDPALVDTSAKKGKSGTWLMDPEDFVIAAANGDVSGATISKNLEENNVVIEVSADGEGEGQGDIIVDDEIKWNTDTALVLHAANDILINSNIIAEGDNAAIEFSMEGTYELKNASITMSGNNPYFALNGLPYTTIATIEELQKVTQSPDGNFVIVVDIDASSAASLNDGKGFLPIGISDTGAMHSFYGNLDGFGHTISNLVINLPEVKGVGLFHALSDAYPQSAFVSNLKIMNADIIGQENVGILAGSTHTSYGAGGELLFIKNVICEGAVSGETNVGGFIGYVNGAKIASSFASADVHAKGKYGVSNYGNPLLLSSTAGGFIGNFEAGDINEAGARGKVYASTAGGFIGILMNLNSYKPSIIQNTYTLSDVSSSGKDTNANAGGFIGHLSGIGEYQIVNSYSAGNVDLIDVEHKSYLGGFIGAGGNRTDEDFKNCYWDIQASGLDEASGSDHLEYASLKGLTTEEMKSQGSFNNWDFQNIWKIDEGKSYPELRGVANSDIIVPEEPSNPPAINPDPVDPNPIQPDPVPPTPSKPDPVIPTPTDPTPGVPTPTEPSTPVQPEKPTPIEPTPITPTPAQPSQQEPTNPAPDIPTPAEPSNPVQPDNPAATEPIPITPTPTQPSQPSPSEPSTSDRPQTPATSNTGSASEPRPTIYYLKDDGNLNVFKDNANNGNMGNNYNNSAVVPVGDEIVEIEDGKTYVTGGGMEVGERPISTTVSGVSAQNKRTSATSSQTNSAVPYSVFKDEMEQLIEDIMKYIGEQVSTTLMNQKEEDDKALKAIRKEILATNDAPEGVYAAYAKFIYDRINASGIDVYSTKMNKFSEDVFKSIFTASRSEEIVVNVDGIDYTITPNAIGGLGKGMSMATVTWKDPKSGKHMLSTLGFNSSPDSVLKTLVEYEKALTNLATEETKEAIAYFTEGVTGLPKDKVKRYIDFGQEIVEAMTGSKKAEALCNKIGEHFYQKYKPKWWPWSTDFKDFLLENIPGGSKLKELATKINTIKTEFQKIQQLHNSAKNFKENKDLLQSLITFNDFNKYTSAKIDTIKKYLSLD